MEKGENSCLVEVEEISSSFCKKIMTPIQTLCLSDEFTED